MNYRINPRNGDKLSILGYGCMRFPRDEAEAVRLVHAAIDAGVNYFDTAYIYGNSEAVLGRALAGGWRDRVKIATKLPPYLVRKYEDLDKLFGQQLARLQTGRIDYYFMHMLTDVKVWNKLVDLGILDWIAEKKKSGQIANIGFSYHGGKAEFRNLVDAYDWEFCMIQYNFFDENAQAGKSGLEYAAAKGLPVMVMEPLKGGTLVNSLPREVYAAWDSAHQKRSPAEWALRWVWNHPQVTTLLSGMSSREMLDENIRVAGEAEAGAFTAQDHALFDRVSAILREKIKVPCTGCSYCMPCPAGVDIPLCFAAYNDREVVGKFRAEVKYITQFSMTEQPANASLCTRCGRCVAHCPQSIDIPGELAGVAKAMEGFYYRPMRYILKKIIL